MTREEAINIIENKIQIDVRFCTKEEVEQYLEALTMALSALTPPTKEQMERVWPGCPHCTQTNARQNLGYQYCERCGRPLTPEAWEELRKRWDVVLWSTS